MANLYRIFKDLLPESPLLLGEVILAGSGSSAGTHKVELIDGGIVMARGDAAQGDKVFVRNGVIEGQAPNLPHFEIEI